MHGGSTGEDKFLARLCLKTNEACGIAQYSPPLRGGVDAPLRKSSRSDMVRPGWSVRRKRGRAGLTTPSAPLRWLRCFLLLAQPPLLAEEGNIAIPGVFRKLESFKSSFVDQTKK